jgi:hypothetical protein
MPELQQVDQLQLGVVLAIAVGAVKLAEIAVGAVRDAYRKSTGNPIAPTVCPLNNGSTKAMVEWLKTINSSLEPLQNLPVQFSALNDRVSDLKTAVDGVKTDTTTIKARQ